MTLFSLQIQEQSSHKIILHTPQIFKNDFAMDLHVKSEQGIPAPGIGESATLPGASESHAVATVSASGGPYRRIIQPAKALVTRSRTLRQTAQAALQHAAKSGGGGGSTCFGCMCCPGKGSGHHANGGSTVALLAFGAGKDLNTSSASHSSSSHDLATVNSAAASP